MKNNLIQTAFPNDMLVLNEKDLSIIIGGGYENSDANYASLFNQLDREEFNEILKKEDSMLLV